LPLQLGQVCGFTSAPSEFCEQMSSPAHSSGQQSVRMMMMMMMMMKQWNP
jgi:hypothetical protein